MVSVSGEPKRYGLPIYNTASIYHSQHLSPILCCGNWRCQALENQTQPNAPSSNIHSSLQQQNRGRRPAGVSFGLLLLLYYISYRNTAAVHRVRYIMLLQRQRCSERYPARRCHFLARVCNSIGADRCRKIEKLARLLFLQGPNAVGQRSLYIWATFCCCKEAHGKRGLGPGPIQQSQQVSLTLPMLAPLPRWQILSIARSYPHASCPSFFCGFNPAQCNRFSSQGDNQRSTLLKMCYAGAANKKMKYQHQN